MPFIACRERLLPHTVWHGLNLRIKHNRKVQVCRPETAALAYPHTGQHVLPLVLLGAAPEEFQSVPCCHITVKGWQSWSSGSSPVRCL